jgi:hypothetical protein
LGRVTVFSSWSRGFPLGLQLPCFDFAATLGVIGSRFHLNDGVGILNATLRIRSHDSMLVVQQQDYRVLNGFDTMANRPF